MASQQYPSYVTVNSATLFGIEAFPVAVTVKTPGRGRVIAIHGLSEGAARESQARVRSALAHASIDLPMSADIAVESEAPVVAPLLDLPIALGLMSAATGRPATSEFSTFVAVGELDLRGNARPIRGAASVALMAQRAGLDLVIDEASADLAVAVTGGRTAVHEVRSLGDQTFKLVPPEYVLQKHERTEYTDDPNAPTFADVVGQDAVIDQVIEAARADRNILLIGPPGSGKSLIARRVSTVLPPLMSGERIDLAVIYSAVGLLGVRERGPLLPNRRPFRAPHHTVSAAGMMGSGPHARPGEVTLAHHGILFLDELPEFRRDTLEVVAHAIRDGEVRVQRSRVSTSLPAAPRTVIAAMNPCPCGWYGVSTNVGRACNCAPADVDRYQSRVAWFVEAMGMVPIEIKPTSYAALREARGYGART